MGALKQKINEGELLTPEDVVKIFNVEIQTARRIMIDDLNGFKVGGRWRALKSELKIFLEKKVKKAKAVKKK